MGEMPEIASHDDIWYTTIPALLHFQNYTHFPKEVLQLWVDIKAFNIWVQSFNSTLSLHLTQQTATGWHPVYWLVLRTTTTGMKWLLLLHLNRKISVIFYKYNLQTTGVLGWVVADRHDASSHASWYPLQRMTRNVNIVPGSDKKKGERQ